jgi:hypothetical protein
VTRRIQGISEQKAMVTKIVDKNVNFLIGDSHRASRSQRAVQFNKKMINKNDLMKKIHNE